MEVEEQCCFCHQGREFKDNVFFLVMSSQNQFGKGFYSYTRLMKCWGLGNRNEIGSEQVKMENIYFITLWSVWNAYI